VKRQLVSAGQLDVVARLGDPSAVFGLGNWMVGVALGLAGSALLGAARSSPNLFFKRVLDGRLSRVVDRHRIAACRWVYAVAGAVAVAVAEMLTWLVERPLSPLSAGVSCWVGVGRD
jgi:hypothetical protein